MSKKQRHSWFVHTYACADVCRQLLGPDCISDESSDPFLLFLNSTEDIDYCRIILRNGTSTYGLVKCRYLTIKGFSYDKNFDNLEELVDILCELYPKTTERRRVRINYPKVNDFTNLQHVLMYQIASVNPWAS